MSTRWQGNGGQHQGARSYQEDAWELKALDDGALLAVVCDGMGGHAGGAVASRLAVEALVKAVAGQGRTLLEGLSAANAAVGAGAAAKAELAGMGTTLVAAIVRDDEVSWISVGDSPFYLIVGGHMTRLNADHSMAPQIDAMVARGVLTHEDAENHPGRHTLREAVMGEPLTLIDQGTRRLPDDARLLLCSDGVQTLAEVDLVAHGNAGPARKLIEAVLAVHKPYQDNITVVLVERKT
jgi:serine/threonine protein phosphatase PrpC